ncbi:hypothetical protein T12_9428 [Trichinella patagoniensis]|uniref:Uncharacterized protein n=1 Tax=Trichinella patagoniensis TaxID=990121 RepID=A0A0V0YYB9_9BILA|nr:hypothetical protein T12_9428 [Trichinella patagoniensis]
MQYHEAACPFGCTWLDRSPFVALALATWWSAQQSSSVQGPFPWLPQGRQRRSTVAIHSRVAAISRVHSTTSGLSGVFPTYNIDSVDRLGCLLLEHISICSAQ